MPGVSAIALRLLAALPADAAMPSAGSAGAVAPGPVVTGLTPLLPPVIILLLCVVAGVATVLLLPGNREATVRRIGGAVLAFAGLVFIALLVRATLGASEQAAHYYFWPFAIIATVSAVRVVTHPKPVYSALYFVLTTFASAGLFVLLWAEFMAAALILIYAGAILVTYVFVIMLAQQATTGGEKAATATNEYDTVSREPIVAATVGFGLMAMLLFVIMDKAAVIPLSHPETGRAAELATAGEATQSIGRHLFEYHLLNLEIAGLILTLATVGAIVIARRRVLADGVSAAPPVVLGPATPVDDDPHSIPVYGTDNPGQKAYPET